MSLVSTARIRVPPGFEALAAGELADRGLTAMAAEGGVDVPLTALPDALLWSRLGSAATVTVGRVPASGLPDSLRVLPWKRFLPPGQKVEVGLRELAGRGLDRKCAAVIAKHASTRRLRPGGTPPLRVLLVNDKGKVDVHIEAAHELWKRGWRTDGGSAPLRENLAAGVLRALGPVPGEWLVDPMCGSGTLAIEGAHAGLGRAPGAWGRFEAEWWPEWDGKAFEVKRQAARRPGGGSVKILASDRDGRQIEAARGNAARARVDRHVRVEQVPFEQLDPPAATGLLVMNPPYGERLAASEKTYRFIGGVLSARWAGWRYGVLVPDPHLARCLPGPPEVRVGFRNGGLRVWLLAGRV